jgi:broad specificity phosphatase PhoE
MTRIWWVRHAPTHSRVLTGWHDIPADLSDTAALARLNAHLPADAIVTSSDLSRATATAAMLAPGRTVLAPDPAFRELHFGAWEGLTHDEVSARWPALSRAYWTDPASAAPPGGEDWHRAAARISAAADALAAAHAGRDIVIVAHMGAILTQYARAMGLPPPRALAQRIDPLSATCLGLDGGRWRMVSVNHRP